MTLVIWVCCSWGDDTKLGIFCLSTLCTAPFGSQALCDMPKVTWEGGGNGRNKTWFTQVLLTCPSTAFCSEGDLLTRDGKEMCSHLFIYTNIIQNIFSMCITWNSNAIPHRSVLICREGMVLSEYGAFIPWTYFLQDVRLCNPAKLWAWLPLEKADSFSVVFFKIYHPPWAFVLSVCRWIDC